VNGNEITEIVRDHDHMKKRKRFAVPWN